MELPDFSERVLLNRERFTEFEETFSLYVLASPQEAAQRTISDLASAFHIAPNAIMRFSRKLGYEGFSDMRLSLLRELHADGHAAGHGRTTSTQRLCERTFALCHKPRTEARAARLLAAARRVVFYAVGETAYLAHAFANRMGNFDEKTAFLTYENQIRRELAHGEGLVLVLVSLSGETQQVVTYAREARQHQARVIAVTDLHASALASYADLALYCCSPAQQLDGITVTDLTPLAAMLTLLERAYLVELGALPQPGYTDAEEGGVGCDTALCK